MESQRNVLKLRAEALNRIRKYFQSQGVLEVDTPLLKKYTVTDPYMRALSAINPDGVAQGFLQTSPEYAMKELLSRGSGDIFQLGKVFRADESGAHHSCEFTMLEWYRCGWSYQDLIEEVKAVIELVAGKKESIQLTYREAFQSYLDIDPFEITLSELAEKSSKLLGELPQNMLLDNYLTLLFSTRIETQFDPQKVTFVVDFPQSQASLAKCREKDGIKLACRFEAYSGGLELANGFEELTDPKEQLTRFNEDNQIRKTLGYPTYQLDKDFLRALETGLPPSSGVAVGFDRLLMLKAEVSDIAQVLPMSFELKRF